MTAQFRCHACGAVRAANEKLIGHRIRCPECDTLVELPMLADDDGIFQGSASRSESTGGDRATNPPATDSSSSRTPQPSSSKPSKQGSSASGTKKQGMSKQSRKTKQSPQATPQEGVVEEAAAVAGKSSTQRSKRSGDAQQSAGTSARQSAKPAAAPLSLEDELAAEEAREANADFETSASNSVESEMDMTPMVDVTFLLLIFFMVTASFSVQQALPVPNPQDDAPSTQTVEQDPEEDHESVTVEVDEFNTYQVLTSEWEEEAPSVQELFARLQESREGVEGAIPSKLIVKAHTEAIHERVVAALDAGQKAGFEEIQLMTVDTEEE